MSLLLQLIHLNLYCSQISQKIYNSATFHLQLLQNFVQYYN